MYPSRMGPLVAIVVRARQFGDRVERLDGVGASGGRGPALLQDWMGRTGLVLALRSVFAYLTHGYSPLCIGFYLWTRRTPGSRELLYADIAVSVLSSVTAVMARTAPTALAAEHGLGPGV